MSDSTSILIFLFVLLFSLVAGSLILIQVRGINKTDKRIQEAEETRQQYRSLLNEIVSLEKKYPQDSTPMEIFQQMESSRQLAAETLQKLSPELDEKLLFFQLDEDLGLVQERINPENQGKGISVCRNCGSQIQGGDKFCANCGFRLQG